VLIFTIKKIKK